MWTRWSTWMVGTAGLLESCPPAAKRWGGKSPPYEPLQRLVGLVVGALHRRVLAEIGRRRVDRAGETAVLGDLGAADHVDRHSGRIGAVLDRQAKLEVHRHASEHRAFHPQEADLVVVLPGDVIGRPDMDVLVVDPALGDRLDRLGLRDLLGGEPL